MKKISAKQVMIYTVLIAVIAVVAVYFLVYKSYNEKAEAIESTNVALQERVDELAGYFREMESNEAAIAEMQESVNAMLDVFPVDVKEEDVLVMAINTEKEAFIDYSTINVSNRESIYTVPMEAVQTAKMENLSSDLIFVERVTSYVNSTDYDNLKECVNMINESSSKLSINYVTYSRNADTQLLDGTIEVTYYSVLGTGRTYIPQELPEYDSGVLDIFGIIKAEED